MKVERAKEKYDQLKEDQGDAHNEDYSRKSLTPYNQRNSIDNSIASTPKTFSRPKPPKKPLLNTDDDFKEDAPDKDLYTMKQKALGELITQV